MWHAEDFTIAEMPGVSNKWITRRWEGKTPEEDKKWYGPRFLVSYQSPPHIIWNNTN